MTTNETQHRMEWPTEGNHTGHRLGAEELALLTEVIESGTLNCTYGVMVKRLEKEFARRCYQSDDAFCIATPSGTAAIHTAIAGIDPQPGDEIITTPITDMGALTPIIYQGAVPIFADVEPDSFNISADTIRRVISPRTKAIMPAHLFGAPCDMEPILELATQHNLPVIEDAAQSPFAEYHGRYAGTLGAIGCFSLQQSKHMTAGEGGFVITRDEELARRMVLFHNKGYGYGEPSPDHEFLALNYRMTELQGAVALAQLKKVQAIVARRQEMAARFDESIAALPGIEPQRVPSNARSAYWKYTLRVDAARAGADVGQLATYLYENFGIPSSPRYVQKPAFQCRIFRERRTFGDSRFPFEGPHRAGLPPVEYRIEEYPGAVDALANMLVLPWNENFTDEHVACMAEALRHAVLHFGGA